MNQPKVLTPKVFITTDLVKLRKDARRALVLARTRRLWARRRTRRRVTGDIPPMSSGGVGATLIFLDPERPGDTFPGPDDQYGGRTGADRATPYAM